MTKIVVVTSGKGGVGKTTTSASFAAGLALTAGAASAQDFKFPIGEDQKFNWKSL